MTTANIPSLNLPMFRRRMDDKKDIECVARVTAREEGPQSVLALQIARVDSLRRQGHVVNIIEFGQRTDFPGHYIKWRDLTAGSESTLTSVAQRRATNCIGLTGVMVGLLLGVPFGIALARHVL